MLKFYKMNVMQGDKFRSRQKGKKLLGNRPNTSKFGNRKTMGVVSSALASSKLPVKTPKYSFDGFVNIRMGPPPVPPGSSRKRHYPTSTTGHRTTNSTSSGNTRSASVLDISSNRDMCTPKYRNTSDNPRGLTSGSRSRTTPCSTTSNTTMPDSCIIVAVSEGRGVARGEVGIVALDLKRPRLTLCQLSDRHSYLHSLTTIHFFHPVEIIVPHTFCDGVPSELYRVIQKQFPNVTLTAVQRRHFSEAKGLQKIQHLCAPEYSSVQLQLIHKFYALTAAAALLKYVEYVQCVVFQPHSLKIEYHASENSTFIDVETAIRLELVESLSGSVNRGCSLLSILNQTYTSGGLRSLRANILQPPCDLPTITTRLNCVQELLDDTEGLMPTLQSVMKQLYDVDKILWLCVDLPVQGGSRTGEVQLSHMLQLKTTMDLVPTLMAALDMAKGQWFHIVRGDLENPKYTEISERIKRVIQDGVHVGRGAMANHQRCFAVKPEINGLLDVARRSYSELVSDMEEQVQQLSETYSLPLRMHTNASRGFHVVMVVGHKNKRTFNVSDLPSIFFEVQNHGSTLSMTTEEIVLMDQQARESLNEIQTMSNIVIFGLLTELRPYMSSLYKLCEHVAELDVILSLAQVSTAGNYVRPTYSTYLELKNSIHPMLDYLIPVSSIPNDVFSSPEYNFHIVTGPNMGGKTIYIKQIALLQIMAQIGCFVPASSAVFRIADRIFSRIGFNDSIECNSSTYVLEMKEIHYIMQTITPTSLVIIDELCRGTSSDEGTSMAWAICEHLLNTEAFVFFTTHFIFLTKLQELYFNVVNLHMKTEEILNNADGVEKKLVYQHKVEAGVTAINHYGLRLAKNTNLPKSIISLAEDLAVIIASFKKVLPASKLKNQDDILLYKLAAELKLECRKPETSQEKLNLLVETFKRAHPVMIQNISLQIRDSHLNTNNVTPKNTNNSSRNVDVTPKGNNCKPVTTTRNNCISQEDPLGSMPTIIPSPRGTAPKPTALMVSESLDQTEDVQASVTVYRKKYTSSSEQSSNISNTTPARKIIQPGRPNIVISDSDVFSDYNETSFVHDSNTSRLSHKSTRNEEQSHIDVNQPSTSKGITHSFPSDKRQNNYGFQSAATYRRNIKKNKNFGTDKSFSEEDGHDDKLQECLTQRMTALFDGAESADKKQAEDGYTSTEELKEILKSPTHSKESTNLISPSVTEYDANENLSQSSNNVWNPCDSESGGSSIMATGNAGELSDIEQFTQDVIMSQDSSAD